MAATPAPQNKEHLEKLWNAYDAFAKFDNAIIFVTSDLFAFEEYLKVHSGPLPSNLVKQFAQDFEELKQDAETLKKHYNFPSAEESVKEIWEETDELSHKSFEKMIRSHDLTHLERALEKWSQGLTSHWRKNLSSLGKVVLEKMTSLEQELQS